MTENERIRVLRKAIPDFKTLETFGSRIGVTAATLSQVETGKVNVSPRLRRDICREFNVNEHWLRTGEGEMFLTLSDQEQIDRFIGEALADDAGIRARVISVLARLEPSEWDALEAIVDRLLNEKRDGT